MFYSVSRTRNLTQRSYQAAQRAAASTSAQPSQSEAIEALQHVTEADKQEKAAQKPASRVVPILDREKVCNFVVGNLRPSPNWTVYCFLLKPI